MFLIEYEDGGFVDGERIDWLNLNGGSMTFTMTGDNESSFTVQESFKAKFLNNLQAINTNMFSIETRYKELTSK